MRGALVVLSVLVLATPSHAQVGGWHIEDVGEQWVQLCSLEVDAQGVPHVGFQVTRPIDAVRYARRLPDQGWVVEHPDSSGVNLGAGVVLGLSTQGEPRLAYLDMSEVWALKVAVKTGQTWEPDVVTQQFAVGPSLAVIAATGEPYLVYVNNTDGGSLYTANHRGGQWFNRKLTNNPVDAASVVLDGTGHPQIAYRDVLEHTLKHARFDGATWRFETVAAWPGPQAAAPSLAVDSRDQPRIAYRVGETVRVASQEAGGQWTVEDVETPAQALAFPPTLRLDARDNPRLVYGVRLSAPNQLGRYAVRYARRRALSGTWDIETVEEIATGGLTGGSFDLDANGAAHVVYIVSEALYLLRYATNAGPGLPADGME